MIDNDLVSSITISSGLGTVILVTTDLGNPVCTLTYSYLTNSITFSSRPTITISVLDFFTLSAQFYIFNNAILNAFAVSLSNISNFVALSVNESFDSHNNNWNFTSSEGPGPNTIDYSANLISQNVTLKNRPNNITIPYSEWISVLVSLNRYQSNVRQFLGV